MKTTTKQTKLDKINQLQEKKIIKNNLALKEAKYYEDSLIIL